MNHSEIATYWDKYKHPSPQKLYTIMRKHGLDVTLKDVDDYILSQKTYQLHKKTRHNIQGHIVAYSKNFIWFADLLDMQNFSRKNKGYKYILICIDVFTRKAHARALKQKSKYYVKEAFEDIFKNENDNITLLTTDSGTEFLNKETQALFDKYNIEHKTVEVALGIIDRFSRTIKEIIFKDFTENNPFVWYDKLQDYIDAYNNSPTEVLTI